MNPFYGFWYGYSTARSYVWVEKYDTREAPNRQVARLMEKDNKKLRDAAKKEWNEQVRVRNWDRRVGQAGLNMTQGKIIKEIEALV